MPRTKGATGKNKKFLLNRLQDMYGEEFHPIMQMAENAVEMQKLIGEMDEEDMVGRSIALEKANQTWDKIAQYTEPKLKAVEVTGELDITTHEAALDDLE